MDLDNEIIFDDYGTNIPTSTDPVEVKPITDPVVPEILETKTEVFFPSLQANLA